VRNIKSFIGRRFTPTSPQNPDFGKIFTLVDVMDGSVLYIDQDSNHQTGDEAIILHRIAKGIWIEKI
jgi:hypothetical protein